MANRPKMSREDRAKQFMPFAALKGYPEALRKKEKIVVPRAEVSEEYAEVLDMRAKRLVLSLAALVPVFQAAQALNCIFLLISTKMRLLIIFLASLIF